MKDATPAPSFVLKSPNHRVGPLLGLSAVLAGLLALEISYGPFAVPDPLPVSPTDQNSVVYSTEPPQDRPAISTFGQILERPLFAQSRRPTPKKAPKLAENVAKSDTFELIGVMISPAGRMALLRTVATGEIVRAIEGKEVSGWEVRTIKPTQVVLRQGEDSDVLKITDAAPHGGNAPSATNNPIASGDTKLSEN